MLFTQKSSKEKRMFHGDAGAGVRPCSFCNRYFSSGQKLGKHMRSEHEGSTLAVTLLSSAFEEEGSEEEEKAPAVAAAGASTSHAEEEAAASNGEEDSNWGGFDWRDPAVLHALQDWSVPTLHDALKFGRGAGIRFDQREGDDFEERGPDFERHVLMDLTKGPSNAFLVADPATTLPPGPLARVSEGLSEPQLECAGVQAELGELASAGLCICAWRF